MKQFYVDNKFSYPISKNIKRLRDYRIAGDWSLEHRNKIQREQYHCQVYLKFFPSTLKCTIDVIVKSKNKFVDNDDIDSILIGKTRIARTMKPGLNSNSLILLLSYFREGVIRIRLVSTLFSADTDVHEDLSLTKLETIKTQSYQNHFDKQFALVLKVR